MKMKLTNTGLAIIALGKKATIQKTTKTLMERGVTMSNNNEGQYIVAGLHPRFGVVKLDTGKRYTLERAERRAGELNDTCEAECKAIAAPCLWPIILRLKTWPHLIMSMLIKNGILCLTTTANHYTY